MPRPTMALRAAIALAVTACGGGPDEITLVGRDPQIIVNTPRDISLEMSIPGILGYDARSKCLTMTLESGYEGEVAAPVWPAGSKPVMRQGKRGVEVPHAGTILEGERLYGDSYAPHTTDGFDHLNLPDECVPPNRGYVFITPDQRPLEDP
ncbi:hypothetical protein AB0K05_11975 [Nonomuraea sp. NPDC049486]|uniref:hypothetical protein n=1 Tax=unclassified Nonomuraea TaxID=2593643 RepID=UPI003441370F